MQDGQYPLGTRMRGLEKGGTEEVVGLMYEVEREGTGGHVMGAMNAMKLRPMPMPCQCHAKAMSLDLTAMSMMSGHGKLREGELQCT